MPSPPRPGQVSESLARKGVLAGAALAAAALIGVSCSPRAPDERLDAGTPIVFISVDTLRSDRLPAYGYQMGATPALDALRRDSILFAHAYAPVPLTLPSHATVLTGLLPPQHGVRDNMGYRLRADELPYLPSALKQLGYRTGAAVSSFVLRGTSGLATDFDFFDDRFVFTEWSDTGSVQRLGSETLASATTWLESVHEDPFFLLFHIYEPHRPYTAPEPFASRHASPYDAEVAAADQVVGDLLDTLRRLDVYDRALLVLFSDHGEGLGDHGYEEHGLLAYREALQVPLMLKLPGSRRGGTTENQPAQLTDLFPTVLSLLGQEVPAELAGLPLTELAADGGAERAIYSETMFPRLHFGWSDLTSLIEYPYHFIDGPDPELFDLEADPGETANLLLEDRRRAARLRDRLATFATPLQAPGDVDDETRRKLAALGYVGGGSFETDGPLPDPKAHLGVLTIMRRGAELAAEERHEEAIVAYRELLEREPGMVDAWEKLGFTLIAAGRFEAAAEAFREALERSGGAPQVALSAAEAYLRMGRLDEAEAHAEVALDIHEMARDVLAQVALRRGDLERADELTRQAVAVRGGRLAPLITRADLELRRGNFEQAVQVTREVEREFGDRTDRDKLRGLYYIRAQALAHQGEAAAAEAAFLAEIELSPTALGPYAQLAYLYAIEGRGAEAGATLEQMVEANPHPAAYAQAARTLSAMGDPRSAAALLRDARRRWPDDAELRDLGTN